MTFADTQVKPRVAIPLLGCDLRPLLNEPPPDSLTRIRRLQQFLVLLLPPLIQGLSKAAKLYRAQVKSILYLCVIFPPSLRPPTIFPLGTKLNQVANAYCF